MILRTGRDPQRGAVAIVVAVFAVVAMLLLAFTVDRGRIYVERAQLQNTMDAAALAAAAETCLLRNSDAIRDVAIDYADRNGVDITRNDVLVQDGDYAKTGVSVSTERAVASVFGFFAGVEETTVAARATAMRNCTEIFQYVAEKNFNFNGSGATIGGNIYAGECVDGGGGIYTGIIMVGADRDKDDCFHAGDSPIYNQLGSGTVIAGSTCEPDAEEVTECVYGQRQVTPADAFAVIADVSVINDGLTAAAGTCVVDFSSDIFCDGDVRSVDTETVGHSIMATGNILIESGTQFVEQDDWIIVYSRDGEIQIQNDVVIPANVVFYAPTHLTTPSGSDKDSVIFQGDGADLSGVVLGYNVNLNGGGAEGGAGVSLRKPGPWTLSQ